MVGTRLVRCFGHGGSMMGTYIEVVEVLHRGSRDTHSASLHAWCLTADESQTAIAPKSASVVLQTHRNVP